MALAAGCAHRARRGLRTHFEVDGSGESIAYLRALDFFSVLGIENIRPDARPDTGRLPFGLQAIESEATAESAARACDSLLRERLPTLASSLRRFARNVMEELGVNIVQHSSAAWTGFALAQAWGGASPRFQIAVADCGVGFLASLQRNLELAGRVQEDSDALQIALTKGLTGTDGSENSGFGLELLRHLSDLVGADLRLVSGGSMLHRRTLAGQRTSVIRSAGPWRGSWIVLDAPLPALPL